VQFNLVSALAIMVFSRSCSLSGGCSILQNSRRFPTIF
jgi:hypothetical protein